MTTVRLTYKNTGPSKSVVTLSKHGVRVATGYGVLVLGELSHRLRLDTDRVHSIAHHMEPIPYFFESIDRNAILVRPKQPFFDWVNSTFEDMDPINEKDECNIYLVHEKANNDEVLRWVRLHFDDIFMNELNDWCTDEDRWPQKRTYALFTQWFSVEVHSMVLDLEDDPVTKE